MLIVDEGIRYRSYKDTVGKTTVGIGFNMDDSHARGVWITADITESFNDVYSGKTALSASSVGILLSVCVTGCKTDLKSIFLDIDSYPEYVQLGLINLMFNMGKAVFLQFNTFINLIKEKEYDRAADDLTTTKWAKQLPSRSKRVIGLFKNDDSGYTSLSIDTSSIHA